MGTRKSALRSLLLVLLVAILCFVTARDCYNAGFEAGVSVGYTRGLFLKDQLGNKKYAYLAETSLHQLIKSLGEDPFGGGLQDIEKFDSPANQFCSPIQEVPWLGEPRNYKATILFFN